MAEFSTSLWHSHLWHPFTQVATAEPPPRVVSAQGSLLYLEDGSTLIDAISSWWVTLHGHAEPAIAAAIAAQAMVLEQVIFANFRHAGAERLAERLCSHTGLDRLFFSDNGSTAVEVALKIAWQWWHNRGEPRSQLVAFAGAYHGDTFGAMAVGERSMFSAPFEPLLFDVARAFLQAVQRLVRQAGALLIADEVLTGFGRSGSLFASQRAGLTPDLMALSKGLTGGFMPMGVTLAREALYAGFIGTDPSLTLFHGHSFTANPLGCASALASLDLLEASPERYQGMEARMKPGLVSLAGHPKVRCPRLLGCAAAFDLAVDEPGYLNGAGQRLQQLVQQQGVFLRPLGSVVYLFPPLATTDEQLDQCFKAIAWALDQL